MLERRGVAEPDERGVRRRGAGRREGEGRRGVERIEFYDLRVREASIRLEREFKAGEQPM